MPNPELVWGMWLVMFLIVEVIWAVNSKRGDTLSETVWDWVGLRTRCGGVRRFTPLRRVILLAFMVSLTLHLVWGVTVVPVIVFGAALAIIILVGIFKEK